MHARHNIQQRNIEIGNTPQHVLDDESANPIMQVLHSKDTLKWQKILGRMNILPIGSRTYTIHFLYQKHDYHTCKNLSLRNCKMQEQTQMRAPVVWWLKLEQRRNMEEMSVDHCQKDLTNPGYQKRLICEPKERIRVWELSWFEMRFWWLMRAL